MWCSPLTTCRTFAYIYLFPSVLESLSETLNSKPKLSVSPGHGHKCPWDPLKGKWSWRWNGQLILLFIKRRALTAVPIGCASLPSSHHEDLYFQIITRPETVKLRSQGSEQYTRLLQTPLSLALPYQTVLPLTGIQLLQFNTSARQINGTYFHGKWEMVQ